MQQDLQDAAAARLYPAMDDDEKQIQPRLTPGMDPHEFALRQLYPSMYGEEWMAKFHERWKDEWD